ncbi:MAG: response regulator [Verrucomicrobiaceae bacterium]|nr:MAG: response regulator [Verrucomicrobiaceae bacterium]
MNNPPSHLRRAARSAAGTLLFIVALHLIARSHLNAPGAALSLVVIFWSRQEGVTGGFTSAALCYSYLLWFHAGSGAVEGARGSTEAMQQLRLWALCMPLSAAMVGTVSHRAGQARLVEQEKSLLHDKERESRLLLDKLQDAQGELEDRERRYRFLADFMPQMIWTTTPEGMPDYFNSRWMAFTGESLDESMSERWVNALHPADRERAAARWGVSVTTGQPYEIEYRLRQAGKSGDEEWRWHLARGEALRDPKGHIVQWAGTCTDIHDQRVMREQLERSVRHRTRELEQANISLTEEMQERRIVQHAMDRILEYSLDVICTVNGEGGIMHISHACEKVLGYAPEEMIGQVVFDFIHPDDQGRVMQIARGIMEGAAHSGFVKRWIRRDGTVIPMMWSANWSSDDQFMVCIGRDISAMKKAAGELETARRAADLANRAKSEFLANMSHEIRTPMNGVMGMTGLLLDTGLSHEQRDFVETIRRSGELLLTVINDILDFSKIEAGKLVFENVEFDLQDTLDNSVELLAAAVRSQGVDLFVDVHPLVPQRLRGDAGRLHQVINNLLSNAIRFTPSGGEVTVRVFPVLEQPQDARTDSVGSILLRFEVKDSGIGMDESTCKRLFEPFIQADASTTRKYGGTGLGLAICKRLVSMMGGSIGMESESGKGSVFHFTARFGFDASVGTAGNVSPPPEFPLQLDGLRVLVVDDSAAGRSIVAGWMQNWRLNPVTMAGAKEVLDYLRNQASLGTPVCVAVIDRDLPGMDGLELARAIHRDLSLGAVEIVLLSGSPSPPRQSELTEAGVRTCLLKPLRPSRLLDALSQLAGTEHLLDSTEIPSIPSLSPLLSDAGDEPAVPALPPAELPSLDTMAAARTTRARVLLAEDNPINQKVALLQLRKLGYEADAVANGQEVLAALENAPYDVILMDCQMPEMDGYETSRHLRREFPDLSIHIIALTANAMTGDRERCLEAGMNDYITKPVRMHELEGALKRWEQALQHSS